MHRRDNDARIINRISNVNIMNLLTSHDPMGCLESVDKFGGSRAIEVGYHQSYYHRRGPYKTKLSDNLQLELPECISDFSRTESERIDQIAM